MKKLTAISTVLRLSLMTLLIMRGFWGADS